MVRRFQARDGVYWVDDAGEWQPVSSTMRTDSRLSASSRTRFFQWGAVRVEISDFDRLISISWSVRAVNGCALSEVLDYLDFFRRGYQVALEYYCDGWLRERCVSTAVAIAAINKSQVYRGHRLRDSVFIRSAVLDDDDATTTSDIRQGLNDWQKSRGDIRHEALTSWVPKLLIYQYRDTDGRLMALSRGLDAACHTVLQPGWGAGANARKFDFDYPSKYFNERVTEAYKSVWHSQTPKIEQLCAIIPRPYGQSEWLPYQRLLVPLTLDNGAQALGCFTDVSWNSQELLLDNLC